jgi:hypothetical protein
MKHPIQSQRRITMSKPSNTQPAPSIRIIKAASCMNLAGKSKLEYHIGCTSDSEVYFRVYSNEGGGFFSPEWVSLKGIQAAFEKAPKPITSYALWKLFKGKSANTPGFLFAALKAEGLVEPDKEKPRCYASTDPSGFMVEMTKLIASDVNLKVADAKTKPATAEPSKSPKKKS